MAKSKLPKLDKRVTLQVNTKFDRGDYGSADPVWENVTDVPDGIVWAEIVDAGGREFIAASQALAEASHRVTIRYMPGITALKHRLLWDGRTLNIVSVGDWDGSKRFLVLACKENFEQTQARGF